MTEQRPTPLEGVIFGDGVELSWQERALCAQTDPEAFFPEKGGSTREAKRVCTSCDVRGECLEYALAHDERFGIWGGLSERERRRLKRRSAQFFVFYLTQSTLIPMADNYFVTAVLVQIGRAHV